MVSHLTGNMQAIAITGTTFFGVFGLLAAVAALYLYNFMDYSYDDETPEQVKSWRKAMIDIRYMLLIWAAAMAFVSAGYLLLYYNVGTLMRDVDDVPVNWSLFACSALGAGLLAYLMAVFFDVREIGGKIAVMVIWTLVFVFLSVGPLSHYGSKRDIAFGLAVFLVGVSLAVFFFCAHHPNGVFSTVQGWIPPIIAICGFVCLFVFWMLGYLNEPSSKAILNSQWETQLGFFLGGNFTLFFLAALAAIMLRAARDYYNVYDMGVDRWGRHVPVDSEYQGQPLAVVNAGYPRI